MTALITYVKQSIELVLLDIPEELVVRSHEVSHRAVCPANLLPGLVHPLGQIHWAGKDLKLLSLEDPVDLLQLPIPHNSVEAKLYFKILKVRITDISWSGGVSPSGKRRQRERSQLCRQWRTVNILYSEFCSDKPSVFIFTVIIVKTFWPSLSTIPFGLRTKLKTLTLNWITEGIGNQSFSLKMKGGSWECLFLMTGSELEGSWFKMVKHKFLISFSKYRIISSS